MTEYFAALDIRVLETLYAVRDPNLVQAFIWITELGSTVTIGGIALATGLILLVRKLFSHFAGLCISVIGSTAIVFPLKEIVARVRPDEFYQAYLESGLSFPSGHAALSLALYGFLAILAWHALPAGRTRAAVIVLAALMIALIGFSRLYLGVHYPSDVVGGYMIGGIALWIGTVVTQNLLARRKQIDS